MSTRHSYRVVGATVLSVYISSIFACVGCTPAPVHPTPPSPTHDVGWRVLVRDYQTAEIYTGRKVRIRLDPEDYTVSGQEIKVWYTKVGPEPIIVCRTWDKIPETPKGLVVTGTCKGPVKDGIFRSFRIDWFLRMDDCIILGR